MNLTKINEIRANAGLGPLAPKRRIDITLTTVPEGRSIEVVRHDG